MGLEFYKNKKVLITGHTGFKGVWLTRILVNAGAEVTGFSRCSEKEESFFDLSGVYGKINHIKGDIRNFDQLYNAFEQSKPEIVFHLAAQPIVRFSYENPIETYETNVIGTVNLLECVRKGEQVQSVLNVTTDKVYQNKEWCWGYRENEPLDGFDPYSNSKSCSELVTHSFKNSFFSNRDIGISTARAGNVIGGGDFAKDRIIPDCLRAVKKGEPISVRNPNSIRPYQHVLESLSAYLLIAEKQYSNKTLQGYFNVGPEYHDCVSTGTLVDFFCKNWGDGITWNEKNQKDAPHEANFLRLDCSKIKSELGWYPKWNIEKAIQMVCIFGKKWISGCEIQSEMDREIKEYFEGKRND